MKYAAVIFLLIMTLTGCNQKVKPEQDLYGLSYNMLVPRSSFEFDADTITGEIVNDAVFNRNCTVEDKYNIIIKSHKPEDTVSAIKQSVLAREDIYDIGVFSLGEIGGLAANANFINLYTVPSLELDESWWSKTVNDQVSIDSKLYFTSNDMLLSDKSALSLIIFHKTMAESYGLENDLYRVVKEGRWTLDYMMNMTKSMDKKGLTLGDESSFAEFVFGAGVSIVSKDSKDKPYLSMNSESTVNTIDKVLELTVKNSSSAFEGENSLMRFCAGYKLFISTNAGSLRAVSANTAFSNSEKFDYCVLPMPKYDENQAEYYTPSDPVKSVMLAVPVTVGNVERSGMILNALAEESEKTTLTTYCEETLKNKYTYDKESREMLDIIFANPVYDLGVIYRWGNLYGILSKEIPKSGENDFASLYEERQYTALAQMDRH